MTVSIDEKHYNIEAQTRTMIMYYFKFPSCLLVFVTATSLNVADTIGDFVYRKVLIGFHGNDCLTK